jgi:PilZ domain
LRYFFVISAVIGWIAAAFAAASRQPMRAPRFPLHLPVRYRPLGGREWRQATTENISASGALVRVPQPLTIDTAIEFRLALLPSNSSAPRPGEVAGHARVVRVVTPAGAERTAFAVAFEDYDFLSPGNIVPA